MGKQTYFTVAEANQKLPWLEVQLQDIASLGKNIERLRLDLDNILRKGSSNGHGDTDQDVVYNRKETDAAVDRLRNVDSLVKTPSSSGGNGRIMWGKGVGAAPGRGRGACSERETRKRASGSPSSW